MKDLPFHSCSGDHTKSTWYYRKIGQCDSRANDEFHLGVPRQVALADDMSSFNDQSAQRRFVVVLQEGTI
jgi:hypothetical protein